MIGHWKLELFPVWLKRRLIKTKFVYGLEAIHDCRAEEPDLQGAGCFWAVGAETLLQKKLGAGEDKMQKKMVHLLLFICQNSKFYG